MSIDEEPPGLILIVIAAIGARPALARRRARRAARLREDYDGTASGRVAVGVRGAAHPGSPAHGWPSRFAVSSQAQSATGRAPPLFVVLGGPPQYSVRGWYSASPARAAPSFGVEASARLVCPSELRPLIMKRPTPGRFELGRGGRIRSPPRTSTLQPHAEANEVSAGRDQAIERASQ